MPAQQNLVRHVFRQEASDRAESSLAIVDALSSVDLGNSRVLVKVKRFRETGHYQSQTGSGSH
jgi:hypothetical protein